MSITQDPGYTIFVLKTQRKKSACKASIIHKKVLLYIQMKSKEAETEARGKKKRLKKGVIKFSFTQYFTLEFIRLIKLHQIRDVAAFIENSQ